MLVNAKLSLGWKGELQQKFGKLFFGSFLVLTHTHRELSEKYSPCSRSGESLGGCGRGDNQLVSSPCSWDASLLWSPSPICYHHYLNKIIINRAILGYLSFLAMIVWFPPMGVQKRSLSFMQPNGKSQGTQTIPTMNFKAHFLSRHDLGQSQPPSRRGTLKFIMQVHRHNASP